MTVPAPLLPTEELMATHTGLSSLPFLHHVWRTAQKGERAEGDAPWDIGRSQEWDPPCPPSRRTFLTLPTRRKGERR
ncbi:hypothetical protein ACFU3E_04660 [Streptomyces sp. NPDC057424]|uniref:hypothetical protein n=1 Tax=Streptomyces sp. NPDC057424 TaxID=3346127 RepID=UPI0036929094